MAPPLKVDPKLLEEIADWYTARIIPDIKQIRTTIDDSRR